MFLRTRPPLPLPYLRIRLSSTRAGLLSSGAALSDARVLRTVPGKQQVSAADLEALFKQGDVGKAVQILKNEFADDAGLLKKALRLCDELESAGEIMGMIRKAGGVPEEECFMAILRICARKKDVDAMSRVLEGILEEKKTVSFAVFDFVLEFFVKEKEFPRAWEILQLASEHMAEKEAVIDMVNFVQNAAERAFGEERQDIPRQRKEFAGERDAVDPKFIQRFIRLQSWRHLRRGQPPDLTDFACIMISSNYFKQWELTIQYWKQMLEMPLDPDIEIGKEILIAYKESRSLNDVFGIHKLLSQNYNIMSLELNNIVMDACVLHKSPKAMEMLNGLREEDSTIDMSLIFKAMSVAIQLGHFEFVIEWMSHVLLSNHLNPSSSCFKFAIFSALKMNDMKLAYDLIQKMKNLNFSNDDIIASSKLLIQEDLESLILETNEPMKTNLKEFSSKELSELELLRLPLSSSQLLSDITTFGSLNLQELGHSMNSWNISNSSHLCMFYWKMMRIFSIAPNSNICEHALVACSKLGDLDEALSVYETMQEYELEINSQAYHFLIDLHKRQGRWEHALYFLHKMRWNRLKPSMKCFEEALAACTESLRMEESLQIISSMKNTLGSVSLNSYTYIMNMFDSLRMYEKVLEVFGEIKNSGLHIVYHNIKLAIRAARKLERPHLALEFWNELLKLGFRPSESTQTDILSVFAYNSEHWQTTLELFQQMKRNGFEPSIRHYILALTACETGNQAEDALEIYNSMLSSGLAIHAFEYCIVIRSFAKLGSKQLVQQVINDMKSLGLFQDKVISFSNIHINPFRFTQNLLRDMNLRPS